MERATRPLATTCCFTSVAVVMYALAALTGAQGQTAAPIGREVSGYEHLEDGEEFNISIQDLLRRGEALFRAQWTSQEGGVRPRSKGVGSPLSDPSDPLIFPRNFNRISAIDSNGCFGCHNDPFGIAGGGGDFSTGVFVAAQRFDFATFNHDDLIPTKGALDEQRNFVQLETIGNFRATLGMFGSGYIEMLSRQMTADLQALRDTVEPGGSQILTSKGVSFGMISRMADGSWNVAQVDGLPPQSLASSGPSNPPSLIIHPFHQSGSVISLRQFTNNAFNHHHGMQSVERFGYDTDPDGDGFTNELTRADITAITVYQATLGVPGQVISNQALLDGPYPRIEEAVFTGERLFRHIGCSDCHTPLLPLDNEGWIYTEPNPYNPPANLQVGEAMTYSVDLSSDELPGYRLKPTDGIVWVPAFTDLKLHDITSGPDDPNAEAININAEAGSTEFLGGNRRFITKKLWGASNERPYFHHGKFTTLREATLAHAGEALASRQGFETLSSLNQDKMIEFLKSLQVLSPGVKEGVVDEEGNAKPDMTFLWNWWWGTPLK